MRYFKFLVLSITVISSLTSSISLAQTYGSEFNFTNKAMDDDFQLTNSQTPSEVVKNQALKLKEEILRLCHQQCKITEKNGKWGATEYLIELPTGTKINIALDPGVVEVQTMPSVLLSIRSQEAELQAFLFQAATNIDFYTAGENAHFNIGVYSAFKDRPDAFLRFFLEYIKLPELSRGGLGDDQLNAPSFDTLDRDQQLEMQKIVEEFNSGQLRDLKLLAKAIQSRVYTKTPSGDSAAYHYQAIGLKAVTRSADPLEVKDQPMEFRAIRHEVNAHEYTLLAELFQARIQLALNEKSDPQFRAFETVTEPTAKDIVSKTYVYIVEAGLDWTRYKILMDESLRRTQPDHFVTGQIDPNNSRDMALVRKYAAQVDRSRFLQKRMVETLELLRLQQPANYLNLLDKIKNPVFYCRALVGT